MSRNTETTGNDRKRHEKRSEKIGKDMREDFCLSVCVKRLETTINDMRDKENPFLCFKLLLTSTFNHVN